MKTLVPLPEVLAYLPASASIKKDSVHRGRHDLLNTVSVQDTGFMVKLQKTF